ncbi:MAG: hypothetical protein HY671_14580 [Chloroflexi bacterium]|nr:hypothetical protein [Chloroflexota bacterium]
MGLRLYGEKPPNDPGEPADPGGASKVTPSEQGMSIGRAMRTGAFWMLVGAG